MARTIRRAAKRSGLSPGYISRVLRGQRNPRLGTAEAIAKSLGVSMDTLQKMIANGRAEEARMAAEERFGGAETEE